LELAGGYVKATTPNQAAPSSFSFTALIKPTSVSGVQKILSIGEKNTNKMHYEVGINGGSLSFAYKFDLGSQKIITAGNLISGIWSKIDVSVDATTTKLHINDQQVFSTSGVTTLLPLGETIVLGRSFTESSLNGNPFSGSIDEVKIIASETDFLIWNLDESRGNTTAYDGSQNHLDGVLIGGDSKVHYFGILPSPTPFVFSLPTLRWNRPTLPPLGGIPSPTSGNSTPTATPTSISTPADPIRGTRPVFQR
jgi:hypothetical protein